MRWLEENIPWMAEVDDVTLKRFFFYFISSCLLGNNQSVLTCKLSADMKVVSVIEAYDWGSFSYKFFIAYLRQMSCQGFRSLEGCWRILTWWCGHNGELPPSFCNGLGTIYIASSRERAILILLLEICVRN